MADTMNPDEMSKLESIMGQIATNTSSVAETMAATQASTANLNNYLETASSSADMFAATSKEILTSINSMAWGFDEVAAGVKKVTDEMKKENAIAEKSRKEAEKKLTTYKKLSNFIGKSASWASKSAAGTVAQVTGLSIGLGTIVELLLQAANNARVMNGMTRQAAAHFSGGIKQISSARAAVMQLRRGFASTYEEAGKVVTSLTQMGMSAQEVEGIQFKAGKFRVKLEGDVLKYSNLELKRRIEIADLEGKISDEHVSKEAEYQEGINVARSDEKEFHQNTLDAIKKQENAFENAENKRRKAFKTTYGAAQELYAIEKQYGVSVQQSGMFVKQLEQDYGRANDEARNMIGNAINTATEIDNIGVAELLGDWQQMISAAQTYKTDVNGILALYNTMMRKEGQMGLEMPIKDAKDLTATVTKWRASLSLGMKAKLMEDRGGPAASRAIAFEKVGYGEQLQRAMRWLQSIVPADIAARTPGEKDTARIKLREAAEKNLGDMPANVAKYLADAVVDGKVTAKETTQMTKLFEDEKATIAANEKKWNEQRGQLITEAGKTSASLLSIQELIQRKAADFAAKYLQPILSWLGDIWSAIATLWENPADKEKKERIEELTSKYGAGAASYFMHAGMQQYGGRMTTGLEGAGISTMMKSMGKGGMLDTAAAAWQSGADILGLPKWLGAKGLEKQKAEFIEQRKWQIMGELERDVAQDPTYGPQFVKAMERGRGKEALKLLGEWEASRRVGGAVPPVRSRGHKIPGGSGISKAGGGASVRSSLTVTQNS